MWNKYVDIHIICITVSDNQRGLKGDEIMLSQFKRQLYDHIGLLIDSSDTNDLISYDIYKKERTLLGENGNCVKMRIIFITKPRTANCKAPFSIEF